MCELHTVGLSTARINTQEHRKAMCRDKSTNITPDTAKTSLIQVTQLRSTTAYTTVIELYTTTFIVAIHRPYRPTNFTVYISRHTRQYIQHNRTQEWVNDVASYELEERGLTPAKTHPD